MLLAVFFFLVSIACLMVWALLVGAEKNRRNLAAGPPLILAGREVEAAPPPPINSPRAAKLQPGAPVPPYISVQIAPTLFITITGSAAGIDRFADVLLEKCQSLFRAVEAAKEGGARIRYTKTHPYNSPGEVAESVLTERQINTLIRKRSTLSLMLEKEVWLGAFEGDHNLGHVEPKLGLLHHTINESVWRELPPMGFPEFEKQGVFAGYPGYERSKIIPDRAVRSGEMRQFFANLTEFLKKPIIFALGAQPGKMFFELSHASEDRELIKKTLQQSFPGFAATAAEEADPALVESDICEASSCLIALSDDASAIRTRFEGDPYSQIADVLDLVIEKGQMGRFEVIARPFRSHGISSVLHYLEGMYPEGKLSEFKAVDKEKVYSAARTALAGIRNRAPMWLTTVRLFASGHSEEEAGLYLEKLLDTLSQYEDVHHKWIATDLTESFEAGLDELAALAHFPFDEIASDFLEVSSMKQKLPPDLYRHGGNRIGVSEARGQSAPVFLPEEIRDRHVYIVGKSGTGKSTLMETIARQDIMSGKGVAVIDPHGEVVENLLRSVPEERIEDCVYFNPVSSPISLDILSAAGEHETDLLADDLVTMFRRTSESWGDRMQAILQMTFQTLLRVKGTSFTDITRLLTDDAYREKLLTSIDHPQLIGFWRERYDRRQAEPILIRMDRLTTSSSLRHILTQDRQSLSFYDVISEGRIFFANLGKGFLGESTSHLIGSIIVSQIQLAAMRQMHLPAEQRIEFSLFVDEVQNVTNEAFGTILSEARKQKLRLTLAHQFVSQLSVELQKAVFGNVGTLVFFSLSPDDLGAARHELGDYEVRDVANLPAYHALCRPLTAARDTFTFATDPPPRLGENFAEEIIRNTREEFEAPEPEPLPPPAAGIPMPAEDLSAYQPAQVQNEKRPAPAEPLSFNTNTEKILHFLRQAEYLSQPQIIALTGLQPSNASTALKKLVRTAQIKNLDDRRPKIYYLGNSCRPTTHNLLVRDLLVKIHASGFAVRSVNFNETLPNLNPDLAVEFLSENKEVFSVYFEIDRGTEGVGELVTKAERYAALPEKPRVGFVFESERDMELAREKIDCPFISYCVLDSFVSLRNEAFFTGEATRPQPFFI